MGITSRSASCRRVSKKREGSLRLLGKKAKSAWNFRTRSGALTSGWSRINLASTGCSISKSRNRDVVPFLHGAPVGAVCDRAHSPKLDTQRGHRPRLQSRDRDIRLYFPPVPPITVFPDTRTYGGRPHRPRRWRCWNRREPKGFSHRWPSAWAASNPEDRVTFSS